MKKVCTLIVAVLLSAVTISIASGLLPVCSFSTLKHDFGNITEGTMATCEFTFTNTGNAPLLLNDVEKACGFAKVEYPTEAIAPGATGKIVMSYNSHGRPGAFRRTVVVKSNMGKDKDIILMVKGVVVSEDKAMK